MILVSGLQIVFELNDKINAVINYFLLFRASTCDDGKNILPKHSMMLGFIKIVCLVYKIFMDHVTNL